MGPGTGRGTPGGEWGQDHHDDPGAQSAERASQSDIERCMTRTAELGSSSDYCAEERESQLYGVIIG